MSEPLDFSLPRPSKREAIITSITELETVIRPPQDGQIEIQIVTDQGTVCESFPDAIRKIRIGLEVDREGFGSESALRVVNSEKP